MTDTNDAINMMNAGEITMAELFGNLKHYDDKSTPIAIGEVTDKKYNVLMNAFGIINKNK